MKIAKLSGILRPSFDDEEKSAAALTLRVLSLGLKIGRAHV